MLNVLGGKKGLIHSHENKAEIVIIIEGLIQLRNTATVGEVIDYLLQKKYPRLPESLERKDKEFREYVPDIDVPEPDAITRLKKMRALSYKEIISFAQFSNEHTPFATKHRVKGAEFENVLVVIGRGWNQYNFDQMLAWSAVGIPSGKTDTYERSRNLFYVCCSRPKKRLAILFTQEVSPDAIATLGEWFEPSNIHAL
jgi:DNA helicase-2/ATP-dependent DNA helicase PcrA